MSKFLNFFISILFIRIIKSNEKIIDSFQLISYDLMSNGNISSRGIGTIKIYEWYSIQGFIIPFTNIKLKKEFTIQLTHKKIKK
jgi:hypothetical protein